SGRGRHTRFSRAWSSDLCASDLLMSENSSRSVCQTGAPVSITPLFLVGDGIGCGVIVHLAGIRHGGALFLLGQIFGMSLRGAGRSEERRVGNGGGAWWGT